MTSCFREVILVALDKKKKKLKKIWGASSCSIQSIFLSIFNVSKGSDRFLPAHSCPSDQSVCPSAVRGCWLSLWGTVRRRPLCPPRRRRTVPAEEEPGEPGKAECSPGQTFASDSRRSRGWCSVPPVWSPAPAGPARFHSPGSWNAEIQVRLVGLKWVYVVLVWRHVFYRQCSQILLEMTRLALLIYLKGPVSTWY